MANADTALQGLGLDDASLALIRGALLEEYTQWARAEAVYQAALAAHPQHSAMKNNLADLYYKLGRIRQAQELWVDRP